MVQMRGHNIIYGFIEKKKNKKLTRNYPLLWIRALQNAFTVLVPGYNSTVAVTIILLNIITLVKLVCDGRMQAYTSCPVLWWLFFYLTWAKGSRGAYSIGRLCGPSVRNFKWLLLWNYWAKFHIQPPGPLGKKSCSNGLGHMTIKAAMPIYGKTLKNLFQNQ